MIDERKSRYELFLEEEARKAQPTKRTYTYKRKYKDRADLFWKSFHARVEKVGDCMEWTGSYKTRKWGNNRPVCKWESRYVSVRRIVYKLAIGELPEDMFVTMTCRNERCVRQSHMKKITNDERIVLLRNNSPSGEKHGMHKKARKNINSRDQ